MLICMINLILGVQECRSEGVQTYALIAIFNSSILQSFNPSILPNLPDLPDPHRSVVINGTDDVQTALQTVMTTTLEIVNR